VQAARDLVAPLGLREPRDIDVEAIAERAKARAILPMRFTRGEGHLLRGRNGAAIIAVREDVYGTPKGSLVVLHEVGHLLHPHHPDALSLCTGASKRAPKTAKVSEGEANDVAAEIGMPEAWFAPRCNGEAPSLGALRDLAATFGMSLTATALRALLFVDEPCALVGVARGKVDWWACSRGWSVHIHRKADVREPASIRRGVIAGSAWGDDEEGSRLRQWSVDYETGRLVWLVSSP
jgi:hypothetical protein